MNRTPQARIRRALNPLLVTVVIGVALAANGQPILRLTSGATTKTITDNGVGDIYPTLGIVDYLGPVGTWSVNVVGKTMPAFGSTSSPYLSLAITRDTPGTSSLKLEFTETGFSAGHFSLSDVFGGTGFSGVTLTAWADTADTPFGHNTLLGTFSYGTGPFNGSNVDLKSFSSAFSLTLEFDITSSTGSTITSTMKGTSVPDAGATGLYLALGLTPLVFFGVRLEFGRRTLRRRGQVIPQ